MPPYVPNLSMYKDLTKEGRKKWITGRGLRWLEAVCKQDEKPSRALIAAAVSKYI